MNKTLTNIYGYTTTVIIMMKRYLQSILDKNEFKLYKTNVFKNANKFEWDIVIYLLTTIIIKKIIYFKTHGYNLL